MACMSTYPTLSASQLCPGDHIVIDGFIFLVEEMDDATDSVRLEISAIDDSAPFTRGVKIPAVFAPSTPVRVEAF